MVEFDHILFFNAFAVIPLLILIYLVFQRKRRKAISVMGNPVIVQKLIDDYSKTRHVLKFIILLLTVSLLIFAVVNIKIGSKLESKKRKGVDIIIALDVSNSMRAQDIKPSRIERAKMAISKLIDKFDDDQIGIIVFAGNAQVLLPITSDYASAKMLVMSADPDMISSQGTAIGSAINLAANSFDKKSKNKKAIILITDGENHEDDVVEATKTAVKNNIIVHTIGMGSEFGAPIPVASKGFNIEYKKDNDGNTVVTKLNESLLKQIAENGRGIFVRASTSDAGLDAVFKEINKMEKKEYETTSFSQYSNTYRFFIFASIILLVIEFLIFERKTSLTRNVDFFGKKRILK